MFKEKVLEVLKGHFGDKDFSDNVHFIDDLDGDDMDIVDVVVQITKKLDIEIPEEETFDIGTVGELMAVVEKHVV